MAIFPLFLLAFVGFFIVTCGPLHQTLGHLTLPGACRRFLGWAGLGHPRLPPGILETALAQVVVVALPEELFFRGWILARLEAVLPPRRRLLGGGIGWALVISAALFAVSHLVIDHDPRRLAVFFPGLLFGWMRSATGSIAAGAFTHAASNLYIAVLQRTFFA
jgi:membrane protease YdiL (CAAX protease family)